MTIVIRKRCFLTNMGQFLENATRHGADLVPQALHEVERNGVELSSRIRDALAKPGPPRLQSEGIARQSSVDDSSRPQCLVG